MDILSALLLVPIVQLLNGSQFNRLTDPGKYSSVLFSHSQ